MGRNGPLGEDSLKGRIADNRPGTAEIGLYRGEQYDPDLGLYYLRARYYNPLTGRFMEPRSGGWKKAS